jgi:hypothetical protein
MRTYSRHIEAENRQEAWVDTVERVVNGTFNLAKRAMKESDLEWDEPQAQAEAQEMFDRMFHMKFLPPGRGLWAMGSKLTEGFMPFFLPFLRPPPLFLYPSFLPSFLPLFPFLSAFLPSFLPLLQSVHLFTPFSSSSSFAFQTSSCMRH